VCSSDLIRAQVKCRELVFVDRGRPRVVLKVVPPASRPLGNWVYLIDPRTGEIVRSSNTMRFSEGRGRVYLRSPVEEAAPRDVVLERLATPLALNGAHVEVVNADHPEAVSEAGEYFYRPDDTHFDEVMAYFHVDRAAELFRLLDPSLPAAVAGGGRMRASVHAGTRMDNAYFDPATRAIYLGDGGGPDRMNDLAKEAAVIYHEYGHAVLDSVNPHLKGPEADALHEGYADYFACSFSDDAEIGEWAVAARNEPHLRSLKSGKRYPRDITGEAHADGEIWAACCWDLRAAAGRGAADALVYESMHFLPEFARFSDAALGIVHADSALSEGGRTPAVAGILEGRGLAPASPGRER
jgi:Zn-dependent metalloprotease